MPENWKLTELTNGHKVESWYDRHGRIWITQLLNADGNQIEAAGLSGTKAGAKLDHADKVDEGNKLENTCKVILTDSDNSGIVRLSLIE